MAFVRVDRRRLARLEISKGGRPPHPFRKLFHPVLHDETLPDPIKTKLNNVIGYNCPYPCPEPMITGHELKSICGHIIKCPLFPQVTKF